MILDSATDALLHKIGMGEEGDDNAHFYDPTGVCVDEKDGVAFVYDFGNSLIQVFSLEIFAYVRMIGPAMIVSLGGEAVSI